MLFHLTAHTHLRAPAPGTTLVHSFIAGVYGTNFVNVPELRWELGYMYFWLLCAGVAGLLAFLVIRMV